MMEDLTKAIPAALSAAPIQTPAESGFPNRIDSMNGRKSIFIPMIGPTTDASSRE